MYLNRTLLKGLPDSNSSIPGDSPTKRISAFLLPEKPLVSLWFTTAIQWPSYERSEYILRDLKNSGIEWLVIRCILVGRFSIIHDPSIYTGKAYSLANMVDTMHHGGTQPHFEWNRFPIEW